MNMRDFLLPLTLALLTTWAVQYFIFNRTQSHLRGPCNPAKRLPLLKAS